MTRAQGGASQVSAAQQPPLRALVVEDDPDIQELLQLHLSREGFHVEVVGRGDEALAAIRRHRPDVVILDVMLPDCSGNDICRDLRRGPATASLPILMLTARSEEIDRVVGFELGADDYVTKPFSPRELVLRIRAVLRRERAKGEPKPPSATEHGPLWRRELAEGGSLPVIERGPLRLDPERHRCTVDQRDVALTAKEFALLGVLMARPGRVMTREQLIDTVWGRDITVTVRTVDTHMKRLREKLGPAGDLIDTVRGVGYRFAD
jgi:two-component system phosphate regulon response regulator PhoB